MQGCVAGANGCVHHRTIPPHMSIAANGTLSNVDLFTIQIVTGAPQLYVNNLFDLFDSSGATLGTLNFSVDVTGSSPLPTPELGTLLPFALGLCALAFGFRRWRGRDPVANP